MTDTIKFKTNPTLKTNPERGDLRVWWIPQVPMESFEVDVPDLKTARLLLKTLALYDLFQLAHRVKPDYANVGGLNIYDDFEGEGNLGWGDWMNDDFGSFDEYREHQEKNHLPL